MHLATNAYIVTSTLQNIAVAKTFFNLFIDNEITPISIQDQNITYTSFGKVNTIKENGNELLIEYGFDNQRIYSECVHSNNRTTRKYYVGSFEEKIEEPLKGPKINTSNIQYDYISGPDGLVATFITTKQTKGNNGKIGNKGNNTEEREMFYILKDHIGSITGIVDESGKLVAEYSYDAWGKRRNPKDWTKPSNDELMFDRGFTGHEHLELFDLINMNGRVYDPSLGRFLSPDNYVQAPDFSQSFNRYSYCMNNPLKYTDPSGDNPLVAAIIIGVAIGAYSGGVMANEGQYNPFQWEKSWHTWGYMIGGGIVGGISGALGSTIAASGGVFANTSAIMAGSFSNSIGMNIVSGGGTPISVSFGAASYDFTNNEWGYLGKKGNSTLANIGYGFGAMANIADVNQAINSTQATLYTEKGDAISHSAIVDEKGNSLMSYGPKDSKFSTDNFKTDIIGLKNGTMRDIASYKKFGLAFRRSTSDYTIYKDLPVSLTLNKYAVNLVRGLGKILPYQGVTTNCSNMASISLWLNGIPNIGIHPYLLYATTWVYSAGIRPDLFSYYLNNR